MAIEIFMPKAGMTMEEGRIIRWLKEIGDPVELNEPVMEIETDKVTMEAESPGSGLLLAKLYPDGTTVPILTTIGYIGKEGEDIPVNPAPAKTATETGAASLGEHTDGKVAATPYARTLARENGIPLSGIYPTGKSGEITGADVDAAVNASPQMPKMRRIIGERMLRSHLEIPPVTQDIKANVNELLAFRQQINQTRDLKVSINDMVIKATAIAAREHECVRTILQNGALVARENVDIGFAVGIENGLLVPVIRGADKLSLAEISLRAKELAAKARDGTLRTQNCGGATLTVSNMGMYGIISFTPIINQPEPVILGVCAISDELAMVDGIIVVNKIMNLCLTFDHRILDGVSAAKFQLRIKQLLENPRGAFAN